ncbi:unnamed protein product, partial [Penicillium salamii]
MRELLRDTAFGKLVRISSDHRILRYAEECDSSVASEYTSSAAEAGLPETERNGSILEPNGLETIMSQASYRSRRHSITGPKHIDEKTIVVGWRANDSENPQNWSSGKKLLVSSLVWLLNFSIYIGSAIYSPAIPQVAMEFGVGNVASTLGLTLFVLGYGI